MKYEGTMIEYGTKFKKSTLKHMKQTCPHAYDWLNKMQLYKYQHGLPIDYPEDFITINGNKTEEEIRNDVILFISNQKVYSKTLYNFFSKNKERSVIKKLVQEKILVKEKTETGIFYFMEK